MKQRLQKIISFAGISSRRKAEALLSQGRVKINGKRAYIGDKADPEIDKIIVDGNNLNLNLDYKVILLNKPKGIVSTCSDTHGRKTVLNFLPEKIRYGLHPIGRLDLNSRGAILLTNNGNLTLKLTHPRYAHKKIYKVWLKGIITSSEIKEWENGIILDNIKTLPAKIKLLRISRNKSLINIIIKEGRNRQIRRTAEQLGFTVIDLQRIAIANININNLQEGEWRELKTIEWIDLINN